MVGANGEVRIEVVDTVGSGSFCGTTNANDIDSTYRVYTMHHAFN